MKLAIIRHIEEYGLDKTIRVFKLKLRDHGWKVLIKYDMIDSNFTHEEVRDSRGLILEKETWKVMSLAFRKFFNAEEGHAAKIDWDTARVLEKLDGTMIQLYWDWVKREWYTSTTGTLDGMCDVGERKDLTFRDLFWKTAHQYDFNTELLDIDYCYIFELTTPYNIVVTPHAHSSFHLLTMRNIKTLKEVPYETLVKVAQDQLRVPVVETVDMKVDNIDEIKKRFEGMPFSEEGYVVVDGNFNRIKIKNPAYVAAHHLKSKLAVYHIMEIIKTNEVDEFIATFPERNDEILKLEAEYQKLFKKLEETWQELQNHLPKNITASERKKFAQKVFEIAEKKGLGPYTGLFFGLKDGKIGSVREFMGNYDNKKLYYAL